MHRTHVLDVYCSGVGAITKSRANRFISPAEVVAAGYQTLINIGYDPTSWYLDNLKNEWKSFYVSESTFFGIKFKRPSDL